MSGPEQLVYAAAEFVWRNSVHLAVTAGPVLVLAGVLLTRWPAARHALTGLTLLWLVLPVPLAHPFALAALVEPAPAPSPALPGVTAHHSGLAWLWVVGALSTGLLLLRRRRAHLRVAHLAETLPDVAPGARLAVSSDCVLPFTVGSRSPVVVLPRVLLEGAEADTLAAVVAHECAHAHRRDDARVVFELWLRALYFFHPLVWFLLAWREEDRERLCDRAALRSSGLQPRAYGRALVVALRLGVGSGTVPGLGARGRLERRLRDLAQGLASRRERPVLAFALALTLGALALPFAAHAADVLLAQPVEGARVTSLFGARVNPLTGKREIHTGIDLGAAAHTAVLAAFDGEVEVASDHYVAQPTRGRVVVLRHASGLRTLYAQLDALAGLAPGDRVKRGQPIGSVGSSGRSTGPHLHFEVWRDRSPLDPLPLLTPDEAHP